MEHSFGKFLFGDVRIPLIGICGEVGQGKSMFSGQVHPEGALVYDFEMSQSTYSFPYREKVTIPLFKKPADRAKWFMDHIRAKQPGEFTNVIIETVGHLENGQAELFALRHAEYGFDTPKSFKATGGIFWAHFKQDLEFFLVNEVFPKFETTIATAHMRNEYEGKVKTGQRIPEGKDTWFRLAHLWLQVSRVVPAAIGKPASVSAIPSAIVRKVRLEMPDLKPDGTQKNDKNGNPVFIPLLPPRLDECTPAQIRKQIGKPTSWSKLKDHQQVQDETLTEDQKLMLTAQIEDRKAQQLEIYRELQQQKQGSMITAAVAMAGQQQGQSGQAEQPEPAPQQSAPEPSPSEPQLTPHSQAASAPEGAPGAGAAAAGTMGPNGEISSFDRNHHEIQVEWGFVSLCDGRAQHAEKWPKFLARFGANTVKDLTDEQLVNALNVIRSGFESKYGHAWAPPSNLDKELAKFYSQPLTEPTSKPAGGAAEPAAVPSSTAPQLSRTAISLLAKKKHLGITDERWSSILMKYGVMWPDAENGGPVEAATAKLKQGDAEKIERGLEAAIDAMEKQPVAGAAGN